MVPVVQDRLQDVRVATTRYLVEETARENAAAVADTSSFQDGASSGDDPWLVEEHAAQPTVLGEEGRQKCPLPAANVHHAAEAPEIIGGQHGMSLATRIGARGSVEDGALLRMRRAVGPDVDTVDVLERVFARQHAMEQVSMCLPVGRTADEFRHRADRLQRLGAQTFAQWSERELSAVALIEDSDA